MNITIIKNEKYTTQFITWLLSIIRVEVLSSINIGTLQKYEEEVFNLYNVKISYYDVVKRSLNNLQILNSDKKYVIQVNPNILYSNTNIKLINLINLLNYGTLQVQGCFIFSNVFENVQKNIEIYYNRYNPFLRRFNYVY